MIGSLVNWLIGSLTSFSFSADILTDFQCMSLNYYGLDALKFVSLPGFSLQAALLKSKAQLQLLDDPTLYLFFERMKRGGISYVAHRQAEANVPGSDQFDPNKECCHIMYADANNLYGSAMIQVRKA